MDSVEAEDWFVVSGISSAAVAEKAGVFEVEGDSFVIGFAQDAKCPRCWKYHAKAEETLCERCASVLDA